ncbi:MAG: Gfo/Idh/MocA family oxidoreductase [Caldilineaceae bacterium]|nr:Gfo/Idh/MocA family oxidoreductase [Caldilineaceae bacterium]
MAKPPSAPAPFRVVLAGCGGITQAWLNHAAQRPDLEFVGLVDLLPENAAKIQKQFELGRARIGTDLAEMIRATGADVVFDCTIPAAHKSVVLTALAHGCHVLGEKPLAESMADAQEMLAAAQASGKTYAVIQNRRYLDNIVRYREVIRAGQIGPLTTLNADFYLAPHFGGFRDAMEHVLLLDMAIHSFDQARYISDADPVSVYCHEWNPPGSWYAHGASAQCIFEMTNGLIFNYRGSWCAEGLQTAWACDWRAIGQTGTARWDGEDEVQVAAVVGSDGFFRATERLDPPSTPQLPYHSHAGVINEFVESLKTGRVPQTVCTDNIKSLAMVHAAIASAENGRKVMVEY